MTIAQPKALARAPLQAIPRQYNFAADILQRNLDGGRGGKLAFIDQTQGWTYGALADRVERFGHGLRALGLRREERALRAPSAPPPSGAGLWAVARCA